MKKPNSPSPLFAIFRHFSPFFAIGPPPPPSDGTTCQVAFFGQKVIFSVSDVSEQFKGSISRFPTNFKKISESRTFDLSRDPTYHRAKISQFQNMLGFIQYGSLLFGIDASSDSAKFQDDWLSKSRLNMKFQYQKLAKNGEFDK